MKDNERFVLFNTKELELINSALYEALLSVELSKEDRVKHIRLFSKIAQEIETVKFRVDLD